MFSFKKRLVFVAAAALVACSASAAELDKRLIGEWEGMRGAGGKCQFLAWELRRFENGRFEIDFYADAAKTFPYSTEVGEWSADGKNLRVKDDDVRTPDIYSYEFLDKDTVSLANLTRSGSADCVEEYKFVDHRARKPLKNLAFKSEDFKANPVVPPNTNVERYLGKWADAKDRVVQIELLRDSDGTVRMVLPPSENWTNLYGDVSWTGDELHFQAFTYSTKRTLFTHPYHKSNMSCILTPVTDPEQIKHSCFIGGRRFDFMLIHVKD